MKKNSKHTIRELQKTLLNDHTQPTKKELIAVKKLVLIQELLERAGTERSIAHLKSAGLLLRENKIS
jgi:hypothetical protein